MTFRNSHLSLALLAASFQPATPQTGTPAPPDAAEVARLQKDVAREQAKGDYKGAALDLRILARLFKNDPAMLSTTYLQLAQVSSQLHDEKKAAEYRALAQRASTPPAAASAFSQQAPAPMAGSPSPAGVAPKPSSADKLSKILNEAQQIMAQARQAQQGMKQKTANTPEPNSPMPPQAGAFPAAPDRPATDTVAQPAISPTADTPVAAGVVIGYDANNQPIFAQPQPASGSPAGGQLPPPSQQPALPR